MNEKINVLNKGFVRLVDSMGTDISISRNARVSYDAEWRAGEDKGSDDRLIGYLMKNGHNTPFESVTLTFDVKAPIFVLRQWHRHRTQCLAGNTNLVFNSHTKMTIKEVYDKWHKGAKAIKSKNKPFYLNRVKFDKVYSVLELASITDRTEATIRGLYRESSLQTITKTVKGRSKIHIKGSDWHKWSKDKRNVFSLRDRIKEMPLRSYNEETGEIYSTSIVDVWKSGKKQLYKVQIGSNFIEASEDHPLLTSKGWVKIKDLKVGLDEVLIQKYVAYKPREFVDTTFSKEELNGELWTDTDFSSLTVSSLGRVKRKGKLVTPSMNASARLVVSIKGENGWITEQVSKLVASSFLDKKEIEGRTCVLHKDDNTLNNRASNLKYGNDKDNALYRIENDRQQYLQMLPELVSSIVKTKVEDTYDIEVSGPFHNFSANGIVTHNSYNELSARYRPLPAEWYIPDPWVVGTQSQDNKQMRHVMTKEQWDSEVSNEEREHHEKMSETIGEMNAKSYEVYLNLIKHENIPRELARTILPVGMYSHMFATANLHNWFGFLRERLHPHAQYEIREYAKVILLEINKVCPVATKYFMKINKIEL